VNRLREHRDPAGSGKIAHKMHHSCVHSDLILLDLKKILPLHAAESPRMSRPGYERQKPYRLLTTSL